MFNSFIVYQGTELTSTALKSILQKNYPKSKVRSKTDDLNHVSFVKIAEKADESLILDRANGILCAMDVKLNYSKGLNCSDFPVYKTLVYCYRTSDFQQLKQICYGKDICAVLWDAKTNSFLAINNGEKTELYYGYFGNNHEIMFSNDAVLVNHFCNTVHQIPANCYWENGNVYLINQKSKELEDKKESTSFVPFNQDGEILKSHLKEGSIIPSIEVDEDLKGEILEQQKNALAEETSSIPSTEIDRDLMRKNLEQQKDALKEEQLNRKIKSIGEESSKPTVNIIKLNNKEIGKTKSGFYHEKFEQILSQVALDEPIMLVGPAGSGKNVAISQVAEALSLHMYYTNNASNEFKLTGFIDAGGNYQDTEFYKAFKNGGVFFLDEIDNSDPSSLIVINSALANGYMAFPHETIDRHKDFRMIAAANTWGKGADLQYVGRNILDAATLDRFDTIFFDYDEKLERALFPDKAVLEFMWAFRRAVQGSRIPHIVSTRTIGKVYKKEINHLPIENILTSNVIKELNQDDINMILGNMSNINPRNKFYIGLKRVRVNR